MVRKPTADARESERVAPVAPDAADADDGVTFTEGSGNVFEDLGLPDAQERLAKAKLAHQITTTLARRHLTQTQAAGVLGISQPKVSDLTRGKLSGFSMERLFKLLLSLDYDVRISLAPVPRRTKSRPSLRVRSEVAASGAAGARPKPVRS
jgi:predicted XRE-type DNA-binding protein